ncbi:hypothetical protein Droror1_Dr00020497 [Drosera rotundifolia]
MRPPSSITYMGPVSYSGNISLRSESSAGSARSFANPVPTIANQSSLVPSKQLFLTRAQYSISNRLLPFPFQISLLSDQLDFFSGNIIMSSKPSNIPATASAAAAVYPADPFYFFSENTQTLSFASPTGFGSLDFGFPQPILPPATQKDGSSGSSDSSESGRSDLGFQGSEAMNRKRTRGRCKIPMARIENKNKRHVAFSKRRAGLFKKASEYCVLTGARVAIITFSEAGKAFTFGNPSADSVISHYLQPAN